MEKGIDSSFPLLANEYKEVICSLQKDNKIIIRYLQPLTGGRTGALLYLVSVTFIDNENIEHLVLKLDRPRKWGNILDLEAKYHEEAEKKLSPKFVQTHMAKIKFESTNENGASAVLYTIAGESLQLCRPLSSFNRHEHIVQILLELSQGLLEDYNESHIHISANCSHLSILNNWLGYRVDPSQGNIFSFLKDSCQIDPIIPGFSIEGAIFRNPYAYATREELWRGVRNIDTIIGAIHGDLNTNNLLVKFSQYQNKLENYFIIDFSNYKDNAFLFFDHAYLELSYLLQYSEHATFKNWMEFVKVIAKVDIPEINWVPIEFASACTVIKPIRQALAEWISKNHPSLKDDLWGLYRLAAIAGGLNFCNKVALPQEERLFAFLYSSIYLNEHCEYFSVSAPKAEGDILLPGEKSIVETSPAWESFFNACHFFENGRTYILVAGENLHSIASSLEPIGRAPWSVIIDFDPDTQENGLYSHTREEIEGRRALHLITCEDHVALNPSKATYWFAANGLRGRQSTFPEGHEWLAWKIKYGNSLRQLFIQLATSSGEQPVTMIILDNQPSYISKICDLITENLGDRVDLIFAATNLEPIFEISEQYKGKTFAIKPTQISAGLSRSFRRFYFEKEIISMPGKDHEHIVLKRQDAIYLDEEMTLLHLGLGLEENENTHTDFLHGGVITWFELGLHKDVDRNKTSQIEFQLKNDLAENLTVRYFMKHHPGAGGTTIARRIAWDLHREFPTILLHKASTGTIGRLQLLRELTSLPILIIVETSEVPLEQVEELYSIVRSENIASILLIVDRQFDPMRSEEKRVRYLRELLDVNEAKSFAYTFGHERKNRKALLDDLANNDEKQRFRVPFYFGLIAFEEDFIKISDYVEAHLKDISDVERRIIGYIALAYHYAHQSIPAQYFIKILGLENDTVVQLERALDNRRLSLLVRETKNGEISWRPTHQLIANELCKKMLCGVSEDRNIWKDNLSSWSIKFIIDCDNLFAYSGRIPSERIIDLLSRLFILRDSRDPTWSFSGRATFSRLLSDIPSSEGRLAVLDSLANHFQDQPHFWGHLGRFLGWQHDHTKAIEAIEKALELDSKDNILHHMKGMALRGQAYDLMDKLKGQLLSGEILNEGIIEGIRKIWKEAESSFTEARSISPDNAYPFVSHIQLLTREIEFGLTISQKKNYTEFLTDSSSIEYQDKVEIAERLLRQLITIQGGEGQHPDKFVINCEADIKTIVGDYVSVIESWKKMLSKKEVSDKSPIRRRLAWAYFGKNNRSWENLPKEELEEIITLMEENLLFDPEDEHSIRLWFEAARRLSTISIDAAIDKLGYLYSKSSAVDVAYYLYMLHAIKAIEGSQIAKEMAEKFIDESRQRARNYKYRTRCYNWLGKGMGMTHIVHYSKLGTWDREKDFWGDIKPLNPITGLITRIDKPEAGRIELSCGLTAFFVPARSKTIDGLGFKRERHENKRVTLLLGFSYDGLRAWDVQLIEE